MAKMSIGVMNCLVFVLCCSGSDGIPQADLVVNSTRSAPDMQEHKLPRTVLEIKTYGTHLQYAALTGSEPVGSGWTLCS